ncbi:YolD-like family protein [Paenibacillus sp. 7124]|uniref:YolD-like family protein n=2 Tax=Paenibacillus apii TaxID=1850370 RepID=A0A6M1PHC7_9BACL|nr:YolD-like family protein [Paenibacillus apii]NGM81715.1 YolD-like family protein [Paenibacillus apii]NJJ41550.1 YolD-like family protein [Paenibacillus apii]
MKPSLSQQERDFIDRALYYSMWEKAPVTLTLSDPNSERIAKGIVLDVDYQLQRIKLKWSEDDWDWIDMDEIIIAST